MILMIATTCAWTLLLACACAAIYVLRKRLAASTRDVDELLSLLSSSAAGSSDVVWEQARATPLPDLTSTDLTRNPPSSAIATIVGGHGLRLAAFAG